MTTTKRKLTALILSIIMALALCVGLAPIFSVNASAADAAKAEDLTVTVDTGASVTLTDVDSDGYYDIDTADELYAFAAAVNGGNTAINAMLTADVDLNPGYTFTYNPDTYWVRVEYTSGEGEEQTTRVVDEYFGESRPPLSEVRAWTPIGNSEAAAYSGAFDGGGHSVSGLYCHCEYGASADALYAGLFGYVSRGTVKNVGVENSFTAGAFIDERYGASSYIGGVVGYSAGTVINCYNTGYLGIYQGVEGTESYYIGGVAGYSTGAVANCYNLGCVTSYDIYDSANANTGGVVGYNGADATVVYCYNAGSVISCAAYVGAVVGKNEGAITDCYYLQNCARYFDNRQCGVGFGIDDIINWNISDVDGETAKMIAEQMQSSDTSKSSWLMFSTSEGLDVYHSLVFMLNKWAEERDPDGIYRSWHVCAEASGYPTLNPDTCLYTDCDDAADPENTSHLKQYPCCNAYVTEDGGYGEMIPVLEAHFGGAATCATLKKCEACGVSYGELDPENHEGQNVYGYCKSCDIAITAVSVAVGQDLTANYYVNIMDTEQFNDPSKLFVKFTFNGKETEVKKHTVLSSGEYVFSFTGIGPHQMSDNIEAEVFYDGKAVEILSEYSVKANAEALMQDHKNDGALLQFLTDMLEYGTAAQSFRDYNLENPANAGLGDGCAPSDVQPAESDNVKNLTASSSDSVYFKGATVWFDNVNKIGVQLSKFEGVKLVVKIGDETEGAVYENMTSTTFYTDAINATEFDTVYTFELYEGSAKVQTLTYSVASYVYAMMNNTVDENSDELTEMALLARALYCYGESAKAYKASQPDA